MKGVYTAKVKEVTILGRLNGINVQVKMELEYENGVSGIDCVKQITEYWHAAGMEAPVPSGKPREKTMGESLGANGSHPSDLRFKFTKGGEKFLCPNCGRPTFLAEGIVKNPTSPKYGEPWSKWYCPKAKGGCGAFNFDDRTDVRFDDAKN